MGNTVSCCVSPESSPKLPSRQPAERLEEFQTSTEVSDDNTVPYLQHISDREVPDGRCPPDIWHTHDDQISLTWFFFSPCLYLSPWSVTPILFVGVEVHLSQCEAPSCDSQAHKLTLQISTVHVHTHSVTCISMKGPLHKYGHTNRINLKVTTYNNLMIGYSLSQLRGNAHTDSLFSSCQVASVYCHPAASRALMITFLALFRWTLHYVDHTGVTLPSQTLTKKTSSPIFSEPH